MSISVAAVILSALVLGIVLIFLKYLIHKDNMRHIDRGRQLELMVGRQVIHESRLLGYQTRNSHVPVPPRYEVALEEARNSIDNDHETQLTHENTRPDSRPPSYESRIFTLQQQ